MTLNLLCNAEKMQCASRFGQKQWKFEKKSIEIKPISRLSMCYHSLHLRQVSQQNSHSIENRLVIELMSFKFQKEIYHRVHFPHVMRLSFQINTEYKGKRIKYMIFTFHQSLTYDRLFVFVKNPWDKFTSNLMHIWHGFAQILITMISWKQLQSSGRLY